MTKYLFDQFKDLKVMVIRVGYTRAELKDGVAELDPDSEGHKDLIREFRGQPITEQETQSEEKPVKKTKKENE